MGFQQGLSGLNTSAKALDVVGNNIANTNTVGFKTARAEFADVFAKSLSGGGASPVGAGSQLANIAQQFTQGNITTTNNPLDLAINGGGFYMMSENGALTYTRNGQFSLNKEGFVVDSFGRNLQGFVPAVAGGPIIASAPTDIFIDPSDLPPKITDDISAGVNLDSRSDPIDSGVTPFDKDNPLTYTSSTSMSIYDSWATRTSCPCISPKRQIPGNGPCTPGSMVRRLWGWILVSDMGCRQPSNSRLVALWPISMVRRPRPWRRLSLI